MMAVSKPTNPVILIKKQTFYILKVIEKPYRTLWVVSLLTINFFIDSPTTPKKNCYFDKT